MRFNNQMLKRTNMKYQRIVDALNRGVPTKTIAVNHRVGVHTVIAIKKRKCIA